MKLELVLQVIAAVGGAVSTVFAIGVIFGGARKRLDAIEKDVSYMTISLAGLQKAFAILLSGLIKSKSIDSATATNIIDSIHARPTGNPISQEEADKINGYIKQFVEKVSFTKEQALEFLALAEKFEADPEIKKSKQASNAFMILSFAQFVSAPFTNKQ